MELDEVGERGEIVLYIDDLASVSELWKESLVLKSEKNNVEVVLLAKLAIDEPTKT